MGHQRRSSMDKHDDIWNWIAHGTSVGAIAGAFWGAIPALGVLVAMIWYCIQIKESETFKKWSARRHLRHIAKLKSKLIYLEVMNTHKDA